jgi:hypothetical protein
MTKEQIDQAFEGRWRLKGNYGQINAARACMSFDEFYDYIKGVCRDFFEAGILIAERSRPAVSPSAQATVPEASTSGLITYDKGQPDLGFDTWWSLYNKKVDRAKCEKKWAKLSTEEKRACIAATPAYVASTPDLQFRRHPMTYLNNKSWENQIIPRNNEHTTPTIDQQRVDKLASILTE